MSEYDTNTTIEISDAVRFLKQLCRHFGHKLPAPFDDVSGRVEFDGATCELHVAGPTTLEMAVRSLDAERAATIAGVMERHLVKFAFRETLDIAWSDPARDLVALP